MSGKTQGGFQQIPIKSLVPSATNPRQLHDEKSIDDMAESIKSVGVLEPVLVRPVGRALEVVAGSRRLAGAKKAGLTEIPAIVREMTDIQALEVQTIENLQREDIHPLDEGVGYKRLMDEAKWDAAKIAERIGKSVAYVHQRVALANLISPAKKAFQEGILATTHALLLCRLQPKDQAEAFKECFESVYINEKKREKVAVSVADLKRWIARHMLFHLNGAPWRLEDVELLPEVGACKTCTKRSGTNPALFSDMASADLCTDGSCFDRKMKVWFERKQEALVEKGHTVKRIATEWLSPGDLKKLKATGQGDYRRLLRKDPKCDNTIKGLVVAGNDRGHVYDICSSPKCAVHGRRSSTGESAKEKASRLAEQKQKQHMNAVRQEAIKRILAAKKPWTADDLVLVVNSYWNEMWHEDQKRILARHEWKSEGALKKAVVEMHESDLWTMILEFTLSCMATNAGSDYQKAYPEKFDEVCLRHGVDVKKLTRELTTKEK